MSIPLDLLNEITVLSISGSEYAHYLNTTRSKEEHSADSRIGGLMTGTYVGNKTYTCPHCNREGKGNFFLGSHFNKCPLKDIDKEQLHKDYAVLTQPQIQSKYNLSKDVVIRYRKQNLPKRNQSTKK